MPVDRWEPIRRDSVAGRLIFSLDDLRGRIEHSKGYLTYICRYVIGKDFKGFIYETSLSKSFGDKVREIGVISLTEERTDGITAGLFVWPNELGEDKTPHVIDKYVPDIVANYRQLQDISKEYGCYGPLNESLQILLMEATSKGIALSFMLVPVVLCVRRPFKLIDDGSSLELMPYLVQCGKDNNSFVVRDDSNVYPLAHRHKLNRNILSRMSTGEDMTDDSHVVMLGCGSLGSKIALHLARGGIGPFTLIDNKLLSPHNLARHALTNTGTVTLYPKSESLYETIRSFPNAANSEFVVEDIIKHVSKNKIPDEASLVVDTTASDAVREFITSVSNKKLSRPVMRTSLFSEGQLGSIMIEGRERNPRIDDIYIKLFDSAIDDKGLSKMLLASAGQRQTIGQGCGSFTMIMPDTVASLYASGMAERARQLIAGSFPEKGELLIGKSNNGMSINWDRITIGPTIIVEKHNAKGWQIRILDDAVQNIIRETLEHGENETGGVLFGKISITRRCITISRTLPAPLDSVRSRTEFILGTDGLKKVVESAQNASGILRYLGTWHSHPSGGEHSQTDRSALQRMRELRFPAPSICLIYKLSGFSCLVDEGDFGLYNMKH